MIRVEGKISGVEEMSAKFRGGGPRSIDAIRAVLTGAGEEVVTVARANAPENKGKLKRSIKYKVTETVNTVTMTAKPGRYYGRFVEGGVDRVVSVKAHTRRSFGGDVKEGRKRVAFGVTFVHAFQRHAKVPAHPFMRPAAEAVEGKIVKEISEAVGKVVDRG